jgi:hypothetical protein
MRKTLYLPPAKVFNKPAPAARDCRLARSRAGGGKGRSYLWGEGAGELLELGKGQTPATALALVKRPVKMKEVRSLAGCVFYHVLTDYCRPSRSPINSSAPQKNFVLIFINNRAKDGVLW